MRLMTKKPMVYVAGPISGGNVLFNIRCGIIMGEYLRKGGYVPFVPHHSAMTEIVTGGVPWSDWLEYDEQIIMRCDALYRIEGVSKGADREVDFARSIGVPVFVTTEGLNEWRDAVYYGAMKL
jgi:hypothetical protein